MQLHTLKPAKGAIKKSKRIGRGEGSKKGGTSGKGHNGAQSRSGYKRRPNSEGGQMPLQIRLPKFGFKCPNRIAHKVINLHTLQELADKNKITSITNEVLEKAGLVSKKDLVKILGRGELKVKLDVSANSFSKTAKKSIEAVGGKVNLL